MFKKLEVGQIVPELQGKDIIQFDLSKAGAKNTPILYRW